MEITWTEDDFKQAEEMDKERLMSFKNYCTVGDLKKFFEEHNMPDDAPVVVQRIFDWYYRKNGWQSYVKKDEGHNSEYHPAFCPVFYPDDPDILFINLHY